MHVILRVLLADGVHGRAKFAAVIGFGGHLNVGQQCKGELWDTNIPHVAICAEFDCTSSMLTLTFLQKSKL